VFYSLSICLGIFIIGIKENGIKFLKIFVPEVPLFLYPMMILIEIGSYIIRSFSLGIRLSANIIAGHTLVHIIGEVVSILAQLGSLLLILPFIVLILVMILEIGVACLQAYIFIVLLTLYLNDSVNFNVH
jgi:ATP synthase subunit 6